MLRCTHNGSGDLGEVTNGDTTRGDDTDETELSGMRANEKTVETANSSENLTMTALLVILFFLSLSTSWRIFFRYSLVTFSFSVFGGS